MHIPSSLIFKATNNIKEHYCPIRRHDPGRFRIIDANLNRLREALRVIEEYFVFSL